MPLLEIDGHILHLEHNIWTGSKLLTNGTDVILKVERNLVESTHELDFFMNGQKYGLFVEAKWHGGFEYRVYPKESDVSDALLNDYLIE